MVGKDPWDRQWVNRTGLSRKHIFDAVDASVERLGTYIDVLQIHRLDRDVPMEEIMRALHEVVLSGKVRYIGASSMAAWEFQMLQNIAEKNGWTKFISMQNYYNLIVYTFLPLSLSLTLSPPEEGGGVNLAYGNNAN